MTSYYVDATGGADGNDGSIGSPWQTVGKIALQTFDPDDVIYLKRGEVWRETFYVPTGGTAGHPVLYDAYGSGATPRITGCDLLTGWTAYSEPVPPLFADGFESGDTSAWSSETDTHGDLNITAPAALVGSYGAAITIDDATPAYVTDTTPNNVTTYRCRFYIDPNSLTMAENNEFRICDAKTSGGTDAFLCKLQWLYPGNFKVFVYFNADSGGTSYQSPALTDAPHYIEIEWKAATAAGANNGIIGFYVDGVQVNRATNVDNDTKNITTVNFGAISEIDAGTSGTFYLDAFYSNSTGAVIGATDPVTASSTIYQATFNNSIDTYLLLEDGEHLTQVASLGALSGVGKFYANDAADTIYAWCTDGADPDTHVMEIGARYDTVVCDDRQHIQFNNLRMHGAGGQYGRGFGLKPTWNTPSDIVLNTCECDHSYYAGIWASYASTFTAIDGFHLIDCTSHDNLTIGSRIEGEDASHRQTNVLLDGCTIDDNGNATFGQFGAWLSHCDAPEVVDCDLHHNSGVLDWSDNLYFVDCPGVVVRRTRAHHGNHSGIHLDVGSYGAVELNLCYENTWNGIWVEEHQSSLGHATTIYNNTGYHNLHGLVLGPGSTIFEVSGVTVKNNVFAFNRRANVELNEDGVGADYLNNTLDYNCYQTDPTDPLYEGEFRAEPSRVNKTFAQWKTYTSWDAHSLNVDPLLTDPDNLDFTLQAGSPCRDVGADVGLTTDYDGDSVPQGGGFDIGAFEFLVATLIYRLRMEGY